VIWIVFEMNINTSTTVSFNSKDIPDNEDSHKKSQYDFQQFVQNLKDKNLKL